ncbi:MAG: sigma-70 family RNA polymerase sigma factor [Actinomycetota bacterium]|nr:sigma-70 family RNA polymerase sigma factor [Actinomycetota bacterium]
MESVTPLSGPVVRPPAVAFRLASDARLVRLAAAGSDGAMAAIFERHHQALHRYCHTIVGNSHDAADALQNTMVKALRALPGEKRQIALRPWLYRIAHNESISLLRARRLDSDLSAAVHVSDAAAADVVDSRERMRSLTEDLGALTERQRGALLMRELGGLEFSDVAEALGTSASAVKQCVYEARCALHAMEEGRAMDCETVRRTLSDGDRRMLRGMRMRGHLRACAGCHDFELALHQRPGQLTAMIPPLPVAVATAMLHGMLGGGGTGGSGGVAVGLVGTAKTTAGFSLGAKAATVVAVSATLAGGAGYAVPELESRGSEHPSLRTETAVGQNTLRTIPTTIGNLFQHRDRSRSSAPARSPRDRLAVPGDTTSGPGRPTGAGKPAGTPGGKPAGAGKPDGIPGGKPDGTPGGRPSGAGKPAATPGGKPAGTPDGRPSGAGKPAGTPAGGRPAGFPGRPAGIPAPRASSSGASATAAGNP